jgi:hypothetical protein
LGAVSTLEEIRHIIFHSFDTKVFSPVDAETWDMQYQKFKNIIAD